MLKPRFLLVFFYVAALMFSFTLVSQRPAAAQTDQRCFTETKQCISGRIREYWEQNGGLPVFGFPTGAQGEELVEGKKFQVQWFERNRLELHPENGRPYDVLLGRLGVVRLEQQNRNWPTFARVDNAAPGCQYFAETGHSLCEPFLTYFRSNGLEFDGKPGKSYPESLALFGLPVSEPTVETNQAGATVSTQWFERARFEHHPQNQPPYHVLLGLLGNEIRSNTVVTPPPPPPPPAVVACEGVPAAKDAELHPSQCVSEGTIIFMNISGFKGGEQVGFWLNNPKGEPVIGTRRTFQIGSNGRETNIVLFVGSTPGIWSWVFQGTTSGHQSIIYIKVQEESDATLHILSAEGAKVGGTATLTAKTAPNASCSIEYFTPSGSFSQASGLIDKTADAQGNVSWSWAVGSSSAKGQGYVAVTCNNFTVSREITIN
jgi:hypothetical protein